MRTPVRNKKLKSNPFAELSLAGFPASVSDPLNGVASIQGKNRGCLGFLGDKGAQNVDQMGHLRGAAKQAAEEARLGRDASGAEDLVGRQQPSAPGKATPVAQDRPRIALFHEVPPEGELVAALLSTYGHDVFAEASAEAFVELVRREYFDLLAINWGSQSMLGIEVLKNVRSIASASSAAQVLVLTSRTSEFEVVQALDNGANDCTLQPGRPFELVARIKVLLRVPRELDVPAPESFSGFSFDKVSRIVQGNGVRAKLAPREFDLARLLFRNFGNTVSRSYLFSVLWGGDGTLRTVDQHIGRIRRKLGLFPDRGFVLQSIYGVGYVVQSVGTNRAAERAFSSLNCSAAKIAGPEALSSAACEISQRMRIF